MFGKKTTAPAEPPRTAGQDAPPGVAETLTAQAAEAQRIAAIEGQELLADPATNPATRAALEDLRARQHAAELELQRVEADTELAGRAEVLRTQAALHQQALTAQVEHATRAATRSRTEQDAADTRADRQRAADDRAADTAARVREARRSAAEQALGEVISVRAEASPAYRVRALRTVRTRFTQVAMAASVLLAGGAAYGMGQVAHALDAAPAVGWAAEVGLTGLSVSAITYRSMLTSAKGGVRGWRNTVLWALFVVPLVASVAITGAAVLLADKAPTGLVLAAVAALGSAAFGALAHIVADTSADAIHTADAEIDDTDLDDLEDKAGGAWKAPGSLPETLRPGGRGDEAAAHAERIRAILAAHDPQRSLPGVEPDVAAEVEAWLRLGGDGGEGAERLVPASGPDLGVPQGASPAASGEAERPGDAEEGQELLLAYLDRAGDRASVRGAARDLKVDPRTVRRYRDALEVRGYDMSMLRRTT